MTVAVRAANSCSLFRSTPCLPISAFRCRLIHMGLTKLRTSSRSDTQFLDSRSKQPLCSSSHGGVRNYSVLSLVDSVIEEMEAIQGRKRALSAAKLGLLSHEELVVDKPGKRVLQKGLLLEFRKDSDRLLLAVAQKPDGKKNQNGATSSIKPQQATYIVPGVENFNHVEIPNFIEKTDKNFHVGMQDSVWVSGGTRIGDEIQVQIEQAHPCDDFLFSQRSSLNEMNELPSKQFGVRGR